MNLIEYINNYDEFIFNFGALWTIEYSDISKLIDIPLNFLTQAELNGFKISDFEKLVGNQMYWTIKAIKNNKNIYENVSSFMNSYEIYPPLCVLTNLIGFILGCKACNKEFNEEHLINIATEAAYINIYIEYILNQYNKIRDSL